MMLLPSENIKVYLALGATDMRKSINGLSILVSKQMDLDPFSGHLFVFCNRKKNMIKVLFWDRNGFCLWHNYLSSHYTSIGSRSMFLNFFYCIHFYHPILQGIPPAGLLLRRVFTRWLIKEIVAIISMPL